MQSLFTLLFGSTNRLPQWVFYLVPDLKPRPKRTGDPFAQGPKPDALDIEGRFSLTRSSSSTSISHIHPELTASSLDVLPSEIRNSIWEEVLGGHTFHLELVGTPLYTTRLGAAYCVAADPSTCNRGGDGGSTRGGCREWGPDKQPPVFPREIGKLLALLMTSKQIYTETIDVLYSSNEFVIADSRVLEWLPITLLPRRINSIRSLRFVWRFANDIPVGIPPGPRPPGYSEAVCEEVFRRHIRWNTLWQTLSAMQGLRSLHVKLECHREFETLNAESAAILLAPIRKVTLPNEFILSLPFPEMHIGMASETTAGWWWAARNGWEGADPWETLPCIIRRTANVRDL